VATLLASPKTLFRRADFSFTIQFWELNLNKNSGNQNHQPQDHKAERFVALALTVFIVLFCATIIWRNEQHPEPNTVVFMRILLSVACGVLGGTIPGFLNVRYDVGGLAIRAAGGLAFAVLTYVYTPTVLPTLQTPTEKALDRSRNGDIGQHFKLVNSYWDLPTNTKRYQNTPMQEREKLIKGWLGEDQSKNDALLEVPAFLADLHVCIKNRRCESAELCSSSLFDDADNFLFFFEPFLESWADSGHRPTLNKAKQFIDCDCYKDRNAKRCPDHPKMCSAPPKCEERAT
jgi:hypothetical protein